MERFEFHSAKNRIYWLYDITSDWKLQCKFCKKGTDNNNTFTYHTIRSFKSHLASKHHKLEYSKKSKQITAMIKKKLNTTANKVIISDCRTILETHHLYFFNLITKYAYMVKSISIDKDVIEQNVLIIDFDEEEVLCLTPYIINLFMMCIT